jgi:hypothetical protein
VGLGLFDVFEEIPSEFVSKIVRAEACGIRFRLGYHFIARSFVHKLNIVKRGVES